MTGLWVLFSLLLALCASCLLCSLLYFVLLLWSLRRSAPLELFRRCLGRAATRAAPPAPHPARHASVLLAPPLTGVRRGSRAGTVSLTRSLTSGSLMVRALAAAWRDSLLKNKKRWDDDRLLWSLRRSAPLSVSAGARAGPPDSRSAYHASLLLAPPWRGHRGGRAGTISLTRSLMSG